MMSYEDLEALIDARKQVKDLEAKILDDTKQRAAALGMTVVEGGQASAPKQKRSRRTKAEIEAAKLVPPAL